MADRYDILIIGGGIAGVSAALTCANRGKSAAVVTNPPGTQSLYKAEKITNYPGIPDVTGKELSEVLCRQLHASTVDIMEGKVLSVMDLGGSFGVAVGNDFYMASAVILAVGITREKLYPGEGEFLGRGVSYCATCDGMLYRDKTVALIGSSEEAYKDAEFLRGICGEVLHFTAASGYEIRGGMKVDTILVKGEEYRVDAVFIIKDTVSVAKLVPGLSYDKGGIVTDREMRTGIPGVFAAGDCTGKPYQLAKAAGEGNIAALSACDYLSQL